MTQQPQIDRTETTKRDDHIDTGARNYALPLLVMIIIQLWLLPLASSFWIDETATFWVVKDGPLAAISRSWMWSGQSPLYYLTVSAGIALAGTSEMAMRLPSVIAAAGATYVIYRLGQRLLNVEVGLLSAIVFACITWAYAIEARPYALGIFAITAATAALIEWLDKTRWPYGIAYTALCATAVYVHYVMGLIVCVHAVYVACHVTQDRRWVVRLVVAWIGMGVLCLPLVPQLIRFYGDRQAHSFTATPGVWQFAGSLVPPAVGGCIIIGLFIALGTANKYLELRTHLRRSLGVLLLSWTVLPPLVCFLVSVTSDAKVFVPRYLCAAIPGLAIVIGWGLSSITHIATRRKLVLTFAITYVLTSFRGTAEVGLGENWRGAIRTAQAFVREADVPVLVSSGFVEGTVPNLLRPELQSVLFAPLVMYALDARIVRLPCAFDAAAVAYLERIISETIGHDDRMLYLGSHSGAQLTEAWLLGRFARQGVKMKRLGDFGAVSLILFERQRGEE